MKDACELLRTFTQVSVADPSGVCRTAPEIRRRRDPAEAEPRRLGFLAYAVSAAAAPSSTWARLSRERIRSSVAMNPRRAIPEPTMNASE